MDAVLPVLPLALGIGVYATLEYYYLRISASTQQLSSLRLRVCAHGAIILVSVAFTLMGYGRIFAGAGLAIASSILFSIVRSAGQWAKSEYEREIGTSVGSTLEIESLAAQCGWSQCTHTIEPYCAVRAAIAAGTITQEELDRCSGPVNPLHPREPEGDIAVLGRLYANMEDALEEQSALMETDAPQWLKVTVIVIIAVVVLACLIMIASSVIQGT